MLCNLFPACGRHKLLHVALVCLSASASLVEHGPGSALFEVVLEQSMTDGFVVDVQTVSFAAYIHVTFE